MEAIFGMCIAFWIFIVGYSALNRIIEKKDYNTIYIGIAQAVLAGLFVGLGG